MLFALFRPFNGIRTAFPRSTCHLTFLPGKEFSKDGYTILTYLLTFPGILRDPDQFDAM